jgi:hypothetical protein
MQLECPSHEPDTLTQPMLWHWPEGLRNVLGCVSATHHDTILLLQEHLLQMPH